MTSLVFVCLGNICRSPMAERVARRMVEDRDLDVEVTSFALSAEESGNAMDRRAAAVLTRAGYDPASHTSRQITAAVIEAADLVVAAEPYQVEELQQISPQATNIRLLNDFNSALPAGTALHDPWYGDAAGFEETLADVEAAMPGILDEAVALAR